MNIGDRVRIVDVGTPYWNGREGVIVTLDESDTVFKYGVSFDGENPTYWAERELEKCDS